MIKIVIRDINKFEKKFRKPFIKWFVFFDLRKLNLIKSETAFFRAITQIRLRNGIFKTTRSGRFIDVDIELIKLLKASVKYSIHDVGVSDGITSVELFEKFQANGINAEIILSDKFSKIYAVKKWFGTLYSDEDGSVLFSDFLGVHINRYTSVLFILSKLMGYFQPNKIKDKNGREEILLLNPKTLKAIQDGELEFIYYDVFEPAVDRNKKYHIVRCMNVLNLGVFKEDSILLAIKNLTSTVEEKGYLVIGRTSQKTSINHFSIFQVIDGKVILVKSFNQGTELQHLVQEVMLQK